MKTLLLILLFLTNIHTSSYGGNYNNSYSNHYNSYSSVSDQSEYRKIGYTTNYGNTFGQTTQQTYSDTYNQSANISSDQKYSQNYKAPRKAKGSSSSDGITVTYETIWQGGILHTTYNIIYTYPNGHTEHETVDNWFGYFMIDAYAQEQAKKRAEQWAALHSVPINGPDFYLVTILLFSYFIYLCMKKRKRQFLLYTKIATLYV